MHSDPISDMATRIRNAQMVKHSVVRFPYSKFKESILEVLQKEKYIKKYTIEKNDKFEDLCVYFSDINFVIKKVSKPGHRVYVKAQNIRRVRNGNGIYVISTSEGVLPGYVAYQKKLGGEILLEIY
jgi:small subunit ribosomal protein S8